MKGWYYLQCVSEENELQRVEGSSLGPVTAARV